MTDEKKVLREQALLHRSRMQVREEDLEKAAEIFKDHIPIGKDQTVAAYWPMGNEFDVRYIIDDLFKAGIAVALPVADKEDRVMRFARWDGKADLVKGAFGIYVPPSFEEVNPDVLIVPFLAFDRKGNRLGRGGGHYDATLASLREKRKILAVGVGHAEQAVLFNLPAEEHDQKLDMVVTPAGVHDFRSRKE